MNSQQTTVEFGLSLDLDQTLVLDFWLSQKFDDDDDKSSLVLSLDLDNSFS